MKRNGQGKPEEQNLPGVSTPGLADRYRELLDLQDQIAAGAFTGPPDMTPEQARDRLAAGVPLLSFDDFFPEWEHAEQAFRLVVKWATAGNTDPKNELKWLNVDMGPSLFRELATAWYNGNDHPVQEHPQASAELVAAVGAAFKPFLQARRRQVMPMIEQDRWRQRHCPVCGGSPDFSFLDKEKGSRWLLCSRCDAEWLFQRLECPYCGTRDQTKLSYLADQTEQYRLYVCDACHTYIKAVDMRQMQHNVRLPLERVLTLDLDRQAAANGYLPPTGRHQADTQTSAFSGV